MSLSYTDVVSHGPRLATTPADEAIIMSIPGRKNVDYLATKIKVIVVTAATTNAVPILETAEASPTVLATVSVGTAAADSTFEVLVAESLRQITAGVGLQVRESVGGDASAVYEVEVITTAI